MPLYFDDNHLASAGLSALAPQLARIFADLPEAP